ncbi:tRNA glutamyl-Q(34) synthetase GluQRS [Glaciecola siphonariae]|uniref:tRNA glutamyl-Q(34) synthetase GluQRS n=1 Tax=Glaciecola siphonariae TaxID=521012 RepID=A0ABV9LWH4_9ALTE
MLRDAELTEQKNTKNDTNRPYIGRFAPSPSGPLHFGSLVCALASFLHARQASGTWLIRIEDIDTPRIDSAFSPIIIESLAAHGMHCDDVYPNLADAGACEPDENTKHKANGCIVYQSERHHLYQDTLNTLAASNSIYGCACSRKDIRSRASYYDQHCRDLGLSFEQHAVRWKNPCINSSFEDLHFGHLTVDPRMANEDPVLKRADGIYAYHLAVVADDIAQGVTHIVRGADLIDTTVLHIEMFKALGAQPPTYLHIPVAVSEAGQKLSKQHHAPAIDASRASDNLKSALMFLGMSTEQLSPISNTSDVSKIVSWAIDNWRPNMLPKQTEILTFQANNVYCVNNPPQSVQ